VLNAVEDQRNCTSKSSKNFLKIKSDADTNSWDKFDTSTTFLSILYSIKPDRRKPPTSWTPETQRNYA
jgi:hypothetical protein